jgi:hypothetical protein
VRPALFKNQLNCCEVREVDDDDDDDDNNNNNSNNNNNNNNAIVIKFQNHNS